MSGFEPELPTSLVEKRIEDKNTKLPDYRSRCSVVWLMIVVDGGRPSTFFDVSGQALDKTYESGFDRIYLFDFQNSKAYRLMTTGPNSKK
jgi:hypothetical protein